MGTNTAMFERAAIVQPSPAVPVASLEWAVQGWRDEVQNRPLINVHRRSLDWVWRKMVKRFGGDPDALLGPDHDALQGFTPMPMHKASPGPDPASPQPTEAAQLSTQAGNAGRLAQGGTS